MSAKRQTKPIEIGDRVMILERDHPAIRQTGVVTEGPHYMTFAGQKDPSPYIVVSVDSLGGHECGVHLSGVKLLRDIR